MGPQELLDLLLTCGLSSWSPEMEHVADRQPGFSLSFPGYFSTTFQVPLDSIQLAHPHSPYSHRRSGQRLSCLSTLCSSPITTTLGRGSTKDSSIQLQVQGPPLGAAGCATARDTSNRIRVLLHFRHSSVLMSLGGQQMTVLCLGPCHPPGRPGWSSRFLAFT